MLIKLFLPFSIPRGPFLKILWGGDEVLHDFRLKADCPSVLGKILYNRFANVNQAFFALFHSPWTISKNPLGRR